MNIKKIMLLGTICAILSVTALPITTYATQINFNTNINQQTSNVMSDQQKTLMQNYQVNLDKKYNALMSKEKNDKITRTIFTDRKASISSGIQPMFSGTYPTRDGVILVTADSSFMGYHYGHAGIIWTSTTTIESQPSGGVERYPNNWNTRYNTVWGISCTDTSVAQDNDASNWCANQVGKPYNYNFFNTGTRNSFYCSQLVWASFHDMYGIDIDTNSSIPGIIVPVDLPTEPAVYTLYEQ
jgi:uncharacterized protein YycO